MIHNAKKNNKKNKQTNKKGHRVKGEMVWERERMRQDDRE